MYICVSCDHAFEKHGLSEETDNELCEVCAHTFWHGPESVPENKDEEETKDN